jgi:hypothetical protein
MSNLRYVYFSREEFRTIDSINILKTNLNGFPDFDNPTPKPKDYGNNGSFIRTLLIITIVITIIVCLVLGVKKYKNMKN